MNGFEVCSINHYVYPCGKASLNLGDASQILTLVRKYKGVDVYPVPLFFNQITDKNYSALNDLIGFAFAAEYAWMPTAQSI
jgi:hypothetical protein